MKQTAAKKSGRNCSQPDSLYSAGYIRPAAISVYIVMVFVAFKLAAFT
jgi:hypothetical protein